MGGAGFSVFELARGVQQAGHEVLVITTCRKQEDAGELEYEGLKIFRIHSNYHERWRAWRSLWNPPVLRQVERILRELRPDAVHANNVHFHISYRSIKLARRYAKRVVWTGRDAMAFSYGKMETPHYLNTLDTHLSWIDNARQARLRYNPLRGHFIRRYLSLAHVRTAVSEALASALRQNGIRDVRAVHTGIKTEEWKAPTAAANLRERLKLVGKKVVLFGGRLNAVREVIEAARLLAPKVPEAVLLIMGKEEGARHFEGSGVPVVFAGWLSGEAKVGAYGAADLVWVPSAYFDAFPRSALEAAAAGKPVIATRYGGARELIEDGVCGFVVDPRDAKQMAERSAELLSDENKRARFGQAALSRAKEEFDFDKYISDYVSLYAD